MRMKMPLLAGALCLASATPAYACNFYFASTFMKVPARPSFGVGVNGELGDATVWGISGDVAMKLGEQGGGAASHRHLYRRRCHRIRTSAQALPIACRTTPTWP